MYQRKSFPYRAKFHSDACRSHQTEVLLNSSVSTAPITGANAFNLLTFDTGHCEHDLTTAINVRVHHTKNVLKLFWHH